MSKKIIMKSAGGGLAMLAMIFMYARLGAIAVALNIVLGVLHHIPALQFLSVGLCVGYFVMVLVKTLYCASTIGGAAAIDRLHAFSIRIEGLFWLSVGYFLVWALALMGVGEPATIVIAVIWAITMIGLLIYLLARETFSSVPQMALPEYFLAFRFGKLTAAFRR